MAYQQGQQPDNKPIDFVTLDNNGAGYTAKWLYITTPQMPTRRTDVPKYKAVLVVNEQEANDIMAKLASYNDEISRMYPGAQLKQDYMKPDKDRNKQPTGLYNFTLSNMYQPKLFDANNNEIDPNEYEVFGGSVIAVNFGVLPFELNGVCGISTSRLYGVKVLEWAKKEGGANFGEATGGIAVPEWAKVAAKPAPQGYQPPVQQGYQPPMQQQAPQGYQPPVQQQGYQPPMQQQPLQGYQPPVQQAYQPPVQQQAAPQQSPASDGGFSQGRQKPVNPFKKK